MKDEEENIIWVSQADYDQLMEALNAPPDPERIERLRKALFSRKSILEKDEESK